MWALVGGALYNNEDLLVGAKREITEKTGIKDIDIYFSNVFGKVDRSPVMRMLAVSYVGIINSKKVAIINNTLKTSDADWFPIDSIPKLAYDHEEILASSLEHLKDLIIETDILKSLFPGGFSLPELQKVYESILNKSFDRRNFRKKILSLGILEDTGTVQVFEGKKPAKIYKFKKKLEKKSVF